MHIISISACFKLEIALHFLASGSSYRSLQYLFRVSKPTISNFISAVCGGMKEAVHEYWKGRERTHSAPCFDESVKQAAKRAREETPPQCKTIKGLSDPDQFSILLRRLNGYANDLEAAIRGTPNTKKEIKVAIKGLKQVTGLLGERWEQVDKSNYDEKPKSGAMSDAATQTEGCPLEGVGESKKDAAVQADATAKLKEITEREGRKQIAIVTPDGLDISYTRKILECIFRGSNMEVYCIIKGSIQEASTVSVQSHAKSRKPQKKAVEERVVVKSRGKTFAELLKSVKESVDVRKVGVKVTGLRKVGDADLMLTVEGAGSGNVLKTEISANVRDTEVNTRRPEATFFIYGMEPTATVDEIAADLQVATGEHVSQLKIAPPKEGRYGNLYTTVTMHRVPARRLIADGRVQIGLLSCEVRERVVVPRCYRCWDFGHRARDCNQEQMPEICINCGEQGHRARDCKKVSYCTKCRKKGHRADQTRCPHFRDLVFKRQTK
nr:unnamed protein product [Callosobruchus analis]